MVALPKLHRKLFRDLTASRAQFGAVVLIIVVGIAIFVGSYEAYQNLDSSYEGSYEQLRMADYWISVDHLPRKAATEMNDVPGVVAQGRIVGDVTIDLQLETGEKVSGRVISLPSGEHPEINDVRIESGSYLSPGAQREILLEKRFAEYHQLYPGDWLTIERDSSKVRFRIAGTVVSPEYIWVTKSAQELFTTARTFGVIFMPEERAEELFGMKGSVNEVNLVLEGGTDPTQALSEVRRVLRRHGIMRLTSKDEPIAVSTRKIDIIQGVRTAYMIERKDQPSNSLLKQDVDGFRQLAVLFPVLFLSMATLAIYVLLNRLVESQRAQIGLMRALGYGTLQIMFHYMGFALVVGVIGSVLGALLGHAIASFLTSVYAVQLKLPFVAVEPHWYIVGLGALIGIIVPLTAGLLPAWATARMRPAEAMRPPVPRAGHHTLLKVLLPFVSLLPSVLKLPLRNFFRNLRRSFFMAMGVASAIALILVSLSFVDATESLMYTQFEVIQNYDARLHFQNQGTVATASYIEHLQGIQEAEPVLELPYRLQSGDQIADSSILGLPKDSTMYTLLTPEGYPTTVASDSILLSLSLQKKLNAEPGDQIHLEPVVGSVGETEKTLAGFINEPLGGRAFMPLEEAQELLRAPGAATGVLLRFDGEPSAALLERLYRLPETASIEFSGEARRFVDELMGFFWAAIGVMLAMGFALGMAIIFNGVTVNVLERRREIAIMRAVGLSGSRLAIILTLENLLIGCLGVAIGIPLGRYIANYFMAQVEMDIFSMTAVIFPRSYIIACVSALVILLVSQIPAIRQVSRLSLPTATKDWSE